ncbi:MAG: hypothetical protein KAI66_01165 [Lentisphaeria bacterium]|nr:hypothetical protein [Lentisphaeria bacterium]
MSTNTELLLAVTGKPVLHSKSPQIMTAALRAADVTGVYTRLAADSAEEALDVVRSLGIRGMNCTAPYKSDLLPLMDEVSEQARLIGGCNTVVNTEGRLFGTNTDCDGVVRSFIDYDIELTGRRVLMVGAGGAARGAVHGLVQAGANICIVNRTRSRADELAVLMGCQSDAFENLASQCAQAEVIVSSLSAHLDVLQPEWLRPGQIVFDANYKGSNLGRLAEQAGCRVISGLDWLLNQAIPAFEHFTGKPCTRKMLEDGLDSPAPGIDRPVALVGFMGCGKSTVGRLLAKKLDRKFIDCDTLIESIAGRTIPEIFASDGEEAFREIEQQALVKATSWPDRVIACGGGVVTREANLRILRKETLCAWLTAPLEATVARCSGSNRPLLQVADPLARAQELFAPRRMLYAQAAHLIVSTAHPDSRAAAEKLHAEIDNTFHR